MTDMYDTNSVWIESEEGKEDFTAPSLGFGRALRFDGANQKHGSKLNETPITRVSFDFRIKPLSKHGPRTVRGPIDRHGPALRKPESENARC